MLHILYIHTYIYIYIYMYKLDTDAISVLFCVILLNVLPEIPKPFLLQLTPLGLCWS